MFLNVPFSQKDDAKMLGAQWNPQRKLWYVPSGMHLEPFEKWLPKPMIDSGAFLVSNKKKNCAHIWDGADTLCRLYSTGGMNPRKKRISLTREGRRMCELCLMANQKLPKPIDIVG